MTTPETALPPQNEDRNPMFSEIHIAIDEVLERGGEVAEFHDAAWGVLAEQPDKRVANWVMGVEKMVDEEAATYLYILAIQQAGEEALKTLRRRLDIGE